MEIVRLNKNSVNDFWRLRLQLFEELKEITDNTNIFELEISTKEYYLSHINKDLISWGVLKDNKIVATGALCLFERIPYEVNLTGKEGYILNIYTCPEFRKQGLAGKIVNEIVKYASEIGINKLWLSSSETGKSIYAKYGFVEKDNEMELFL